MGVLLLEFNSYSVQVLWLNNDYHQQQALRRTYKEQISDQNERNLPGSP